MKHRVVFVGRISKWSGDQYAIVIPSEVLKKNRDLLEKWNASRQLLVIEIEELDGMVRT